MWTLANAVSLTRILLVPLVGWLAWQWIEAPLRPEGDNARLLAFGLFVAVAATDGLDGWLARRMNQVTRLGSWLDPIADRSLALMGIFLFTRPHDSDFWWQLPVVYSWFVLGREVLLLTGAATVRWNRGRVDIRPVWLGKAATIAQLVVAGAVLLKVADFSILLFWSLVLLAVGVTFCSGVAYTRAGMRQMNVK